MTWLTGFLLLNFLQMVISQCMVYQVPPQSFQLPCVPPKETSDLPLPAEIAENPPSLNEEHTTIKANTTALMAEDNFLCCHWSDTHIDCVVYTAEMESEVFTYSDTDVVTSQQIDSVCNLQFWTKEKTEELFCIVELSTQSSYQNEEFTVNLLYALTDISLEGISTNSLKDNFTVNPCNFVTHQKYECRISSAKLSHTYVMLLKITKGIALLQSPLMSVSPMDIVKPEPPFHLQTEMTDKGQLKISWSSLGSALYPLQYEVKCFANSTKNVWQVVEITLETSLILSSALLGSSYVVQVRCKRHNGPGLWSDWSTPYNLNLQAKPMMFRYKKVSPVSTVSGIQNGIPADMWAILVLAYVMYFPPKILASDRTNVSFYCVYKTKNQVISSKKIVWWLNLVKEIPRSQYTLVNDYISKVTLVNLNKMKPKGNFLFNALYCCNENKECNHRYAELYIVDVTINITCETYGNLQKMTCRWSSSTDPLLLESNLLLRYYRSDVYCSESPNMPLKSEVKKCSSQTNNSYECIFQPFYLLSGYTMWIEIKHSLGTLTSQPVCILPKEVVKPFSPSSVKAEIIRETGQLHVNWNNPELPKNDLRFQIRYAVNGTEITWKMHEVSSASDSSANLDVQDPCVIHIVQVRCSVIDGVGYWSDWSSPAYTIVKDIRALYCRQPECLKWLKDSQSNPTHIYSEVSPIIVSGSYSQESVYRIAASIYINRKQPLSKNLSLCSVLDYVVEHTTSENVTWSDYVENYTSYTFSWMEDKHTIKILAINSIGASSVNFILTLSQQMSTVNIVESFSAYPVNSSCVIVSWTLSPSSYVITAFVIEWENLNEEEQIKWMMAPSNVRKFHLYGNFILIEKYRFSLYTLIPEGVTKPAVTDGFSKGGTEKQNDVIFSVILPLVISCLVLLLAALLILHQRLKNIFWDDVPNPKNCSWAQGVNFQKPETFEHHFLKHPEALSFGPLLLEQEIVLEDVSIDNAVKIEDKQDVLAVRSLLAAIQDLEHDSACSSDHFNSNSLSESVRDVETSEGTTGQSNVKYATIICSSESSGLLCKPPKDFRNSFGGCLLDHDSLVSASFSSTSWLVGNQAFLILPSCHPDPPRTALSLSVVSSEGFSEPSDQDKIFTEEDSPERSMFYLGMSSIKRSENNIFLTENSKTMCHFHTNAVFKGMRFPPNTSCDLNPFISKCESPVQTFIPYMPQFQTLTVKLHETASSKA